jgi:hypothetical protein
MKNHSLSTKGLSLSQAQSISNLCNQACRDINSKLNNINNATRELTLGDKTYTETQGHPLPSDLDRLLQEKARLHATQAFLMENIKAKDSMISSIKREKFEYNVEAPEYPDTEELPNYYETEVDEDWGWAQLSKAEYSEYLEAEAYASHIGQFIHKGGKLDKLRQELPTMKTLEWMEVEAGKKTPLTVTVHHTIDQLGVVHESLAAIHRTHEQKVNYYKAKVKNLVTAENARLAKELADTTSAINERNDKILAEYQTAREKYQAEKRKVQVEFEEARQKKIAKASALRIEVDIRFKDVVHFYLGQLDKE